jgi:hypothetical protein
MARTKTTTHEQPKEFVSFPRNEHRGLLIRGTLHWGVPYYNSWQSLPTDCAEVTGMIVSSALADGPCYINLLAENAGLELHRGALYSSDFTAQHGHFAGPRLASGASLTGTVARWGYARVLVHRDHPLLAEWGHEDGTLPLLFKAGELERLVISP